MNPLYEWWWLGFFPIALHLFALIMFVRIATIPVGYGCWWLGWGLMAVATAVYGYLRLSNTIEVVAGAAPVDPTRIGWASLAAGLDAGGAWFVWRVVRPSRTEAGGHAVAQIQMDVEGKIVGWNEAATALFGWTEEEAVNKEFRTLLIPEDVSVEWNGQWMPAREAHLRGLDGFLRRGRWTAVDTLVNTVKLHKDGRKVPVDRLVSVHTDEGQLRFLYQLTSAATLR